MDEITDYTKTKIKALLKEEIYRHEERRLGLESCRANRDHLQNLLKETQAEFEKQENEEYHQFEVLLDLLELSGIEILGVSLQVIQDQLGIHPGHNDRDKYHRIMKILNDLSKNYQLRKQGSDGS